MKLISLAAVAALMLGGLAHAAGDPAPAAPAPAVSGSGVFVYAPGGQTVELPKLNVEEVKPAPAPAPAAAPAPAPAPVVASPPAPAKPKARKLYKSKPARCVIEVPCIDWPKFD